MEASLENIRHQQKESWNKFSPGWDKWDNFTMDFLRPMGDAIIASLALKDSDRVLDIATGTGEPGLTIAGIVGKGTVIGTDLSDGMLAIARTHAEKKGLKNFETQPADVCELPFAGNSFDAISCRFGFMFFPDMQLAAHEMARVLKPGGRIATSVWAEPAGNRWATIFIEAIKEVMQIPAPPPGAPGLFRCAAPGTIESLFLDAGLKDIAVTEISGDYHFRSADFFWEYMNDVVAPVAAAMAQATEEQKERVRNIVFASIDAANTSAAANLKYAARIISGMK